MSLLELLLVALGLSMDAFSVAICKGLALRKATPGRMAAVGLWFGGFQALMPVLGFLLGDRFAASIARYDHWIILVLLCLIGVITFLISAAGVKIGSLFGLRYRAKAEICGGVILILLGFKILLEHLGVL